MYTNLAYLGRPHEDIVNTDKPLLITAAGYYRVHSMPIVLTERPKGRGDYQLLYIAAGKAHFYFDGKERVVGKGHMVLFRPGEPQIYYLYAAEKPETYWVHFTGCAVEALLDEYRMPREENVFFTGISPDYQWLYRQMIQELQLRRVDYEDFLGIDLRHIFLMINRYLKEGKLAGTDVLNEIERATHYFYEHYNEPIKIEQYAEAHMMSACWFIQNFKRITKITPMQYVVSLRITNAMQLLDTTNYRIAEIAEAVGYENALYFSRLFRRHVGMSPREYKHRGKA